jgi:catechol 2,3-dioxygenase-like lactoylglutathione lyase family enzyme
MTAAMLEHVNVTVRDPQRTADMLCRLFGWKKRWEGPAKLGGFTIHVGSEDSYLAIYRYPADANPGVGNGRLNHIGILVDDLDAAERKVREAGFEPHSHADYQPGRRFYFDDHDGIEFEVVSYG